MIGFRLNVTALLLAFFVIVPTSAIGQSERYGVMSFLGGTAFYEIDGAGATVSTFNGLPSAFVPRSFTMGADNRTVRFVGHAYAPSSVGAIYDLTPNGVTTVSIGAPLHDVRRILHTSDGDWLLFDSFTPTDTRLLRFDGAGFSTLATFAGTVYGAACEPNSRQLIIRGNFGGAINLLRLDPATGALTSFGTPGTQVGSHSIVVNPADGAVIEPHWLPRSPNTVELSRYHPLFGRTPIGSTMPGFPIAFARAEQRTGVYGTLLLTVSQYRVDLVRVARDGTILSRVAIPAIVPDGGSPLVPIGGRHLAWQRVARPNDRRLSVSVPSAPGRGFIVGMSFAGIRPGVPLGDGRHVALVPDPLTALCLRGGIPGLLGPTLGALDANGRATVRIDANPFGASVRGLTAWVCVVILDPSASRGISHLLGPERIPF